MDRKELVKQAVLSVTEKDVKKYGNQSCAVTIRDADKCKEKQLQNAVSEYAKGCRQEDIAVLVDQTILGNGKKGFLFSTDGFYASRNILVVGPLGRPCIPYPIVYEEIDSVKVDPKEVDADYLIINYKNGFTRRAYGCTDNCYIVAALNAILRALAEERRQENEAMDEKRRQENEAMDEKRRQEEEPAAEQPAEKTVEPKPAEEQPAEKLVEPEPAVETEPAAEPVAREPEEQQKEAVESPASEEEQRFAAKKAAAEAGDAQAQFELGLMCEKGEGTTADLTEALRWYETAANQGHSQAQNYTGYAYKKGRGTEPDGKKAVGWYKKSAMGGYPPAQRNYALSLLKGEDCDKDPEEALYWMEQSAANGLDRAQERVAQMYEDGEGCDLPEEVRKKKARGWYEKAAEQGKVNSQFSCGLMYYNGEGGEQDREKALSWFLKAAEQGNISAQMNCGVMYLNGDGTDRDPKEALRWFMSAGEGGSAEAAFRSGIMYYNGEGCSVSREETLRWLQKAIELGHEKAQEAYDIASRQMQENETAEKDLEFEKKMQEIREGAQKRFEQAKEAAKGGDMEAQYDLAEIYDMGMGGVKEDKAEALNWYEKAASQGHAKAQYRCAMMYRDGEGTKADQMKAVEWCRKSALQDYVDAQATLGIMYYDGDRGTPKNTARGLYWLEKAKYNRNIVAAEQWKKFYIEEHARSTEALLKGDGSVFERDPLQEAVEKDKKELLYARKCAANRGDAAAQFWYGNMLEHAEGTKENKKEALYWYEKAAEQGYVQAMYECASCYEEGSNREDAYVEKDPAKAFHWYEKAAENGYGYAQRRLAQVYDEGYHNGLAGVERDRKKALYWYQKAAEQNVDGAQARYDWIMMDEQPDVKNKITSQAVLLCGNSTFHHLMLTKMLEQHGFGEIYKTDSVREAEKLYRKKKPGMVLLGLTVGGSVTTETVEMMDRKYPDAKIVLLVTMGQERMAEDLKRKYHVIADVLVSPYAKDRVGEIVLNVMRPKE